MNTSVGKEQQRLDSLKEKLPKVYFKHKYLGDKVIQIKIYTKHYRRIGYANVCDCFDNGMSKKKKYALYICYTEINSKFQGKGYGEQLYRKIIKYAQRHKYKKFQSGCISNQARKVREKLMHCGKKYNRDPNVVNVPIYNY